jgi:transposase-like protein
MPVIHSVPRPITLRDLGAITSSELSTVAYLQQFGVIPLSDDCDACGRHIAGPKERRDRSTVNIYWRCPNRHCRRIRSVRDNVEFLTHDGNRNRLPISTIATILYLFATDVSRWQAAIMAGVSANTIGVWYNFCRDVCLIALDRAPKMGGEGELIEIDESLFGATGKYRRGRMLAGDVRDRNRHHDPTNNDNDAEGPRNYGNLVQHDKWVFGICWWRGAGKDSESNEVRYVSVQRRDADTLLPLIERHVAPGSVVFSDEWAGYRRLQATGLVAHHGTVNHQEEYVNRVTGANTQAIETAWERPKRKILKNCKGVPADHLPRYLAEAWWRSRMMVRPGINNPAMFEQFLKLVGEVYQ